MYLSFYNYSELNDKNNLNNTNIATPLPVKSPDIKEAKEIVNSLNIDENILNKPFSLIKNEELETLYNKLLQNN